MTLHSVLEAGFVEPIFGAQSTFRAVMNALAEPGTVLGLPPLRHPAPLPNAMAAIALALVDSDTALWCDNDLVAQAGVTDWVDFHLAASRTRAPNKADFALCTQASLLPALSSFALGTDEYPDRSTTIILSVTSFDGGAPLLFSGPGIPLARQVSLTGLPADFVAQWNENATRYPRGVDLLLVTADAVMGLPRTTRIAEGA